jgi:hypothetical protein
VQQGDDAGRAVTREGGEQVRVDIEDLDVDPGDPQGVGDAATRADRHVALGGEPPGENDDAALRCGSHAA